MSAALELVKLALRAYAVGDPEITIQLCHPLIRWDERASRPDGELVWGQDDVLRAMRSYHHGWERYRFEVEKIAEVGSGRIVGLCRERGVEKQGDGIEIDRRYGGLWVVEASKIVSWSTYLTPAEAVRAARELVPSRFVPEATEGGADAPPNGNGDPEAGADGDGGSPKAATGPVPPEPEGPLRVRRRVAPREQSGAAFSEEQRAAAKRRAALIRAAREGARRAPTA